MWTCLPLSSWCLGSSNSNILPWSLQRNSSWNFKVMRLNREETTKPGVAFLSKLFVSLTLETNIKLFLLGVYSHLSNPRRNQAFQKKKGKERTKWQRSGALQSDEGWGVGADFSSTLSNVQQQYCRQRHAWHKNMIWKHAALNFNVVKPLKAKKRWQCWHFQRNKSSGSDRITGAVRFRVKGDTDVFSFEVWAVSNHQGTPRVMPAQIKDMTGRRSSLFQKIGVFIKPLMGRTCLSRSSGESSSAWAQISFKEHIKVSPAQMHKGVLSIPYFTKGLSAGECRSLPAGRLDLWLTCWR